MKFITWIIYARMMKWQTCRLEEAVPCERASGFESRCAYTERKREENS
jgi:hypothetical protein